jgi:hypothetical protein
MELDFAFLAKRATVQDSYLLDITAAGIEDVTVAAFPFRLRGLVFVLRLRLHPLETEREHVCTVEFWDPDGARLMGTTKTLASAPTRGAAGRSRLVTLIAPLVEVALQSPGNYSFEVAVDGIHLKSVPFSIQVAPREAD